MPTTKWQKMIFAFITVFITVHLFVFYNLSYVNGLTLDQLQEHGVSVFGYACPIWMVIFIEFICAYTLELLVGSPCSFRLASKVVNPAENKPYMVETAIICATVGIMCPAMSFLATWFYNDINTLTPVHFLALWLKTIMHNFPLAFFSQLFLIQPLVRTLYGWLAKRWTTADTSVETAENTLLK